MKKQKNHKKNRGHLKTILLIILTTAVTAAIVLLSLKKNAEKVPVRHHMTNTEVENYIVKQISSDHISSRYSPVLIYRIIDGKAFFTGSGTYTVASGNGRQIITAEHLFSTNEVDNPIGVRFVRPMQTNVTELFDKVIFSSKDFNGLDLAFATLTTTATNVIKNFSILPKRKSGYVGTADHVTLQSGKNLSRLRSLVTGKWHSVVGAPMESEQGKGMGISINGFFVEGESGSGFVDEDDNLYVLTEVQDESLPSWKEMARLAEKACREKVIGIGNFVGPLSLRNP